MLNIKSFLNEIKNKRLLIVGDLILDEYLFSEVERISPEAPVPVAHVRAVERRLGGAANVANNIVSLGAKVLLIGQIGNDSDGEVYTNLLNQNNIEHSLIVRDDFNTIKKVRVVSHNQQLIRIDFEEPEKINEQHIKEIHDKLKNEDFDVILISDYNKGFVTKELIEMLKGFDKKILVDPKPANVSLFRGVYAMFPNENELNKIIKTDGTYLEKGKKFVEMFDSNLVLTRGSKGAAVFTTDNEFSEVPSKARMVYDVTGAGDTFFSVCSLGLAVGYDLFTSVVLANTAAGIVVSKVGTAVVSPDEIESEFRQASSKIKSVDELKQFMKKNKDKTFVFTNGCFDILHPGHIKLLKEAKAQGDYLIVALNSDESVRKLKGKNRPILCLDDRMEVISSLVYVDFVTSFSELTPEKIISELKPDVHVKGGDYNPDDYESFPEAKLVKSYGGRVHIVPLVEGKSTTNMIKKAKNE